MLTNQKLSCPLNIEISKIIIFILKTLIYPKINNSKSNSSFYFIAPFESHFQLIISKRALRFLGKPHKIQLFTDYSIIVATRPDPTVRPPSRIRFEESCVVMGVFSEFSVIIFSENIVFLCSFRIFVAIL